MIYGYVNKMKDWRVKLATQHELVYISSPFCPARSTFLTYDLSTRVLFSGELFSGILNREDHPTFWVQEKHLDGILAYHQLHMPATNAIRYTLQNIRQLEPKPLIIAPLYGNLIRANLIDEIIDKLYNLPVGSDLLHIESTPEQKALYLEAANDILAAAYKLLSPAQVNKKLNDDERITSLCKIEKNKIQQIYNRPERMLEQMMAIILMGEPENVTTQLKSVALKSVVSRKLPPISLGKDATEYMVEIPSKIFKN